MEYSVKKYAGYIPATAELLADSDAAISTMLINWLGEESVATENAQILAKINTKEATPLTGIKDIKKAINVTLAAFAGSVVIVTNSNGLQYLDTLEDKNGRPLLSPDPTKPMEMSLSVGARSIPVKVLPNDVLGNTEGGAIPLIIGDLHEYGKMFDRAQLTISVSDVAAIGDFNAYEQDMTLFRGIMRADFKVKDAEAIVRGELTVAG
jgi:HK97 family phage major capsid protein